MGPTKSPIIPGKPDIKFIVSTENPACPFLSREESKRIHAKRQEVIDLVEQSVQKYDDYLRKVNKKR